MKFRRAKAFLLATAMLVTGIAGGYTGTDAQAASKKGYGTATVRILATTDMHGQSVRLNYDSGVEGEGSLAQIAGIIKRLRKSMKHGTTVTVDCGDNLYGIGSESIMKGTVSGAEYMYEEMADLGYDAITLGNHDFDYGVDYIKKTIAATDLRNKVVLSNVVDAKTKKNLYKGSMMVKKTVKTTTGKKKTIKIGFIGAIIPSLSTKTDGMINSYDSDATYVSSLVTHVQWQGVIETKDIVKNVRSQAKALKKKGADLVIVLAHSGIGNENYKNMDDGAGYALTAIPEVDAVCGGHTHMDFPSDSAKAAQYYDYSETDSNGLMHGKPLIEEKDHGASLGIADLKLGFNKWGTPYVKSSSAKIRTIKASDPEDSDIVAINNKYDEQYQKIYDQSVTTTDREIDNYFGMIEDNPLIHLCNQAKIAYGQRAVKHLDDKYKNAPVIASTEYQMAGNDSTSNYLRVDGTVHVKDLLNLEAFNQQRAKVYYITGAQLRESLEYQCARYFQTQGQERSTEGWDSETKALVDQGMKPVLSPEYCKGWEGFRVYDGIEYVINPTITARYDKNGDQINNKHRVVSLTRNGVPVNDTDIFVLVARHISRDIDPTFSDASKKQLLVRKTAHLSSMLETYMKTQTINGTLQMSMDGNWRVTFPQDSNYIIRSSSQASDIAKTKVWYQGEIPGTNGYTYYKAALGTPVQQADTYGPFICASPMETEVTGDPVKVRVEANDISSVTKLQYIGGIYKADDAIWSSAADVKDNAFSATENGTYTVRAEDSLGNANVNYVTINNIDGTVSVAPSLNGDLTNRKKTLTGQASPFATVYLSLSGMEVNAKADAEGRFTFNLPTPGLADDIAELYQVDIQNRKSAVRKIKVGRTGANTPGVVNDIKNTDTTISGIFKDDPLCTILVEYDNTVYVPKGADAKYKASSLYKTTNAKNVKFTRNGDSFTMDIPVPMSGQTYKVYGVDWIGRLSTLTQKTVVEAAPNQPKIDTVVAEDAVVSGSIPSPTSQEYTINVTTGDGKTYTGTAGADGHFAVETDGAPSGTKVTVSASDVRDGVTRTSLSKSTTMKKVSSLLEKYSGGAEFSAINDEDKVISGSIYDGDASTDARIIVNGKKDKLTTDASGAFSYELSEPLKYKDKVTLVVRDSDGSINDIEQTRVEEALPDKPVVTTEKITASTKKIRVVGNRDCTAVLKSGKTTVKAESEASEEEGYIYKLTIPESLRKKGTHLKVYLKNTAGESEAVSLIVG